ncbi:YlcI/YnfO family protein [Pantoea sp. At-9b]|jgi:hypothetical protein|uniref:YlcI/YnfO family protein n=1 Tax=Pantoea sp. (strain At-9b) TaxID=592316 RepID=UPI0001B3EBDF|nr:YlcI/YnfO family protein [Pantoea sp. At-9b]ADU72348.1 conserved hypothetical protein [Pantoea sp. At-9b]
MATAKENKNSQSFTARIPNEIFESMEAVKQDGESNAKFIVNALRGEIARRQT